MSTIHGHNDQSHGFDEDAFFARIRTCGSVADLLRLAEPVQLEAEKALVVKIRAAAASGRRMSSDDLKKFCAALGPGVAADPDMHRLCFDAAQKAGRGDLGRRLRDAIAYDALNDRHAWVMASFLKYAVGFLLRDTLIRMSRGCVTRDWTEAVALVTDGLGLDRPNDFAHVHQLAGLYDGFGLALDQQVGGEGKPPASAQGEVMLDALGDAWEKLADREKARPIKKAIKQARNDAIKRANARSGATKTEANQAVHEVDGDRALAAGVQVGTLVTQDGERMVDRVAEDHVAALEKSEMLALVRGAVSPFELDAVMAEFIKESDREVARRHDTSNHRVARARERAWEILRNMRQDSA